MTISENDLMPQLLAADAQGMTLAVWARVQGERPFVIDPSGAEHTFAKVNANANRLARLLRARGLKAGDAVALVCSNRVEFIETLTATLRAGLRLTPVNWHLTREEIAYIVRDCEAKALIAEARSADISEASATPELAVKLSIGGDIAGFEDYERALSAEDAGDITDPTLGGAMLYTSGTTGRPKGVLRQGAAAALPRIMLAMRGYDRQGSVQLCAGPAYHAAPLTFDIHTALLAGCPLVLLDKWDSENTLRTIAERKVTHMHLVPIMFQRLLALPDDVRRRYDIGRVSNIIHGAAPCPPEVKRAMIDWFGPVLSEYYAGSEGGAGFFISSEEWLKKPGSVGRRPTPESARILDEQGNDCPTGQPGTIYHRLPDGADFTYFKDEQKTRANRVGQYFTMGDIGYLDADDYLFLTGRNAETIISGGVNIYPQEIDNELIKHEAVADAATVGIPHDEWGEQVRAVIQLKPGFSPSPALAEDLIAFARAHLPGFKVPRGVDFVSDLPRSEAGKIQRNKVRAPYWEGRSRQI